MKSVQFYSQKLGTTLAAFLWQDFQVRREKVPEGRAGLNCWKDSRHYLGKLLRNPVFVNLTNYVIDGGQESTSYGYRLATALCGVGERVKSLCLTAYNPSGQCTE